MEYIERYERKKFKKWLKHMRDMFSNPPRSPEQFVPSDELLRRLDEVVRVNNEILKQLKETSP